VRLSSCAGDIAVAIFVPCHKGRATVRDTWRYLNLSRGHQPFDIFRYFPDISSPNQAIRWRSLFGFLYAFEAFSNDRVNLDCAQCIYKLSYIFSNLSFQIMSTTQHKPLCKSTKK